MSHLTTWRIAEIAAMIAFLAAILAYAYDGIGRDRFRRDCRGVVIHAKGAPMEHLGRDVVSWSSRGSVICLELGE